MLFPRLFLVLLRILVNYTARSFSISTLSILVPFCLSFRDELFFFSFGQQELLLFIGSIIFLKKTVPNCGVFMCVEVLIYLTVIERWRNVAAHDFVSYSSCTRQKQKSTRVERRA